MIVEDLDEKHKIDSVPVKADSFTEVMEDMKEANRDEIPVKKQYAHAMI